MTKVPAPVVVTWTDEPLVLPANEAPAVFVSNDQLMLGSVWLVVTV